jgi:methylase of polypeptide subunit release factors
VSDGYERRVSTDSPARDVPTPQRTRFGSLDIAYDDRLLKPREWTTAQSEWAAELLESVPDGPVLELCAGAGHIGLLAIHAHPRPLVAVDLNPVACAFIAQNAASAGLGDHVEIREGEMEAMLAHDDEFAMVIADPPWVPRHDIGRFPEDPQIAIDGGDDGLDLARACIRVIGGHLMVGGTAVLQLGNLDQADALTDLAKACGLVLAEPRTFDRGVLVRLDRG